MLYLGADHNGFYLKEYLKKYLDERGIIYVDLGNKKFQKTDDYPDWAKLVAKKVQKNKNDLGILMCGSGQGMCITANRYKNVRAAFGWSAAAARRVRHDDDANILCLPAWGLTNEQGKHIVSAWLNTAFAGLTRYKRRIKKIDR